MMRVKESKRTSWSLVSKPGKTRSYDGRAQSSSGLELQRFLVAHTSDQHHSVVLDADVGAMRYIRAESGQQDLR